MKVGLFFADRALEQAVADLLAAAGHETVRGEEAISGCDLRIGREGEIPEGPGPATLLLSRRGEGRVGREALEALRSALGKKGRVVWRAPLSGLLLLEALGSAPRSTDGPDPAAPRPDLESLPHPWLAMDPATGLVLAANAAACSVLDVGPDGGSAVLDRLALPGSLREAVGAQSQGMVPFEAAGESRVALWWTDSAGRRELCLPLRLEPGLSREDLHHRSLAELGRMAATLAHEIRNPVASVAGALDLLEESEDPQDRRQIVAMARERLRHLTRLLETALYLARPMRQEAESVSLGDLASATVSDLRGDPNLVGIEFTIEAPPDDVRVRAPAEMLRQALTNLLLNATQAQDGKGRVTVRVARDRRRALLRVIDDGPGIAPERREQVFQPFFTTKASGSGLGLSVVRRVADAVGGAVSIEDAARGACFLLELPIDPGRPGEVR